MGYYGLIAVSVVMFSLQFFFNQQFRRHCGDSLSSALILSAGSAASGFVVLWAINGFRLEVTPFTLFMALISAFLGITYNLCSLRALAMINLSLYSVFAMLGGMLLPFFVGTFFYDEPFTTGKLACVIIVAIALFISVKPAKPAKNEKPENKDVKKDTDNLSKKQALTNITKMKSGLPWYFGVFLLNGTIAAMSKVFAASTLSKTSAASYSALCAAVTAIASLIPLLFIKKRPRLTAGAFVGMFGNGLLNKVANFFLLIALVHVPASVQYPFITGGVMICSTVISFLTNQRPSLREVAAVIVSFVGIMMLIII